MTGSGSAGDISASMQLRDAELNAMMSASSSFDFDDDAASSLQTGVGAQADRQEEEDELEGNREHGQF